MKNLCGWKILIIYVHSGNGTVICIGGPAKTATGGIRNPKEARVAS